MKNKELANTVQEVASPLDIKKKKTAKEDLTGREQMVSNVIFSWVGHFVFIVAGFIMPRMIDRQLGQEMLGIWDFAWSLVVYFKLLNAGISSAVNRYVAKYRSANDNPSMNQTVSSACFVLLFAGILGMLLTIAVSLLLPRLFGTRLGENISEAQIVVFLLGISLSIEISFNVFSGVLGGCHKWGLLDIVSSVWYAVTVVGMICSLLLGGSLASLALANCIGAALADITRMVLAFRVCKGLRIHLSFIGWKVIKKLLFFGGKTVSLAVTNILLYQTVNLLILAYLGPAMLALYCRPRSLIIHLNTLVRKIAYVTTPSTSSLQSTKDLNAIRDLLIKSVRYSVYIALPAILLMAIYGGSILHLWMGQRYANDLIPAILAIGYFTTIIQLPLLSICAGLNTLGKPAIAYFITAVITVGLAFLTLGPLGKGLAGTAVAVTVPLTLLNAVYMPIYICRWISLPLKTYFRETIFGPFVCVLPFGICLLISRLIFHAKPLLGLVCGGALGGAFLAIVYWEYVMPNRIKTSIFRLRRILV